MIPVLNLVRISNLHYIYCVLHEFMNHLLFRHNFSCIFTLIGSIKIIAFMVRNLLFLFILLFPISSNAQELKWIYKIGGTTAEYGNGLAVDVDQNIYDITNFMGTVSVAPMVSYSSRGEEDILVRKSTGLGILQWVRQIGGLKQDLAYDVAVDNDKNVFVIGTFSDTLYLGNEVLLTSLPNIQQSFILKLNSDGNKLWVKSLTSNIAIQAKSITAGSPTELLITGTFEGTAQFGLGFASISHGANDVFVLKLNGTTGETLFIRQIGGTDQEFVYQHCRDKDNNIYLTGDFRADLDLDPGSGNYNVSTRGLTDIFLVKLNSEGVFLWGRTYGSIGLDYGHSVATNQLNEVLLTGRFSDNISFGSTSQALVSRGGTDIFLAKINNAGTTSWIKGYGGMQNDIGNRVIANKNNIIFLAGMFRDQVDFDPSTTYNNSAVSGGGSDAFIAVYNQDGSYNDHFSLGGIANEQLGDIALKTNGDLISTGGFGAIADFDPTSSEVNIFSNGGLDAFLWNTFVCINPYLKEFHADKTTLCPGEDVFIRIDEGYLNDATQWSWQRDSCNSITFASGSFLNIPVPRNTTFLIKGYGGCVVNDPCKKIDIKLFKDSLVYQEVPLCEGDTLNVGSNAYTRAGVYIDSLQSTSGCDSVLVTEITLYKSYQMHQSVQICNGDTVKVGSFSYTLPGVYTSPLTTIAGCDSIITTEVTVLPSVIDFADAIICKGDSVTVGGITYNTSGTFIQTSIGANGCEDQLIINLTVLETEFDRNVTICAGDSIKVGNNIYKSGGQYIDRLVSGYGCDSIITTHLTVFDNSSLGQEIFLCLGDSIKVGAHTYFVSGNYIDTLQNAKGCDSLVFTKLKVVPLPAPTNKKISLCEGQSVSVGTHMYTTTGLYRDTLAGIHGCDSIVITDLTVFPKNYLQSKQICQGEEYKVGNMKFNKTGSYTIGLKNYFGCDSIIMLDLTVRPVYTRRLDYLICPGDSIFIGNYAHTHAGIFLDTLQSVFGCDSIITADIKLNTVQTALDFSLCSGESVTVNNKSYNVAGIFRDTLTKTDFCDSILILNIKIFPRYEMDTLFEICKGGSVTIGSSTYFNAGQYTEYLQTKAGCDSIIRFEIKIVNFAPTFSISKDTLKTFNIAGASYQWYECKANEFVPFFGATNNTFVIVKSGKYALGITYKGCTYISDCIEIMLSDVFDLQEDGFYFYPNPVVDFLTIESKQQGRIQIMTSLGHVVRDSEIFEGRQEISLSEVPAGIYAIKWIVQNKIKYFGVIKL